MEIPKIDPRFAGHLACLDGLPLKANPYRHSIHRQQWIEGWTAEQTRTVSGPMIPFLDLVALAIWIVVIALVGSAAVGLILWFVLNTAPGGPQ